MSVVRTVASALAGPLPALTTAALALCLAGCDRTAAERTGRPGPSVRDSAGIEIVDIGRVSYDELPQWRMAERPVLDIGRVAGEEPYLLYRVRHARRLADGSILVLSDAQLRKFDSTGAHLWSQGERGDGPGMYRSPTVVTITRGDSIAVSDGRTLNVLGPEGTYGRTVRPPGVRSGRFTHGATATGRVLVWDCAREDLADTGRYVESGIACHTFVTDLEGELRWSMGRIVANRSYYESGGRTAQAAGPWTRGRWVGVAPGGIWYAPGEGYELHFHRDDATPSRIVRWDGPDLTVTEDDVRIYDRHLEERGLSGAALRLERSIPKPEDFPPYARMIVDGLGRPWLLDYVRRETAEEWPPPARRWTVLAADGSRVLGRVEHPREIFLLDAGEGWVLVVEPDELDVEHVRLYPLVEVDP